MSPPESDVCFRVVEDELIWRVIEDEAVVVHAATSAYYGVNITGTVLWSMLATSGATVDELAGALSELFSRDAAVAHDEASEFVRQAIAEGLVVVESGQQGRQDGREERPTTHRAQPYEPPTVVRFGDLETLVLSGE